MSMVEYYLVKIAEVYLMEISGDPPTPRLTTDQRFVKCFNRAAAKQAIAHLATLSHKGQLIPLSKGKDPRRQKPL